MAKQDSPHRAMILVCLVATLSYFAAKLGGTLIIRPQMVSPLWLGNVLLVSMLLLVRRRIRPVLLAAGLAAFLLYDLQANVPIHSIVWLILSNAVEVVTATLCLSNSFDGIPRLNSVKALAKYSFYAVILAPFVGAFPGALSSNSNYWTSWKVAFFSEALGFLTLMPALLGWATETPAMEQKPRAYYLEAAALLATLVLLGYLTFVSPGRSSPPALLYSLVPFLLWSALRFGSMGVSTSMIVIAFVSIWGAVHGRGPFTEPGQPVNVLSLQLFLFFTAAPFMALAALVEERKRAERDLSELSGRLIHAHEEERARIARELHDDFGQRMALIQVGLERFQQDTAEFSSESRQQFHNLAAMTSEVSSNIHNLSHQLHPSMLGAIGLTAALRTFCRELSAQHNLQVQFVNNDVPERISKDVALCLFRIAQEALRNVVKHSGAAEAQVELSAHGDQIDLCISDSGKGFDPAFAQGGDGLGLISMRERLRLVGGRISIESEPSHGTRILARIPLSSTA
jgi:signal transduction histidine kinase